MKIARVFPRKTKATPTDELAFIGEPGLFVEQMGIDKVYVSVAFTWDLPYAEYLVRRWSQYAPVEIGGPATGMPGGDFIPGMFLKNGYVITSRGCRMVNRRKCWYCSVLKREGNIRELPITEGWNVLDDNLLACSESHIRAVFAMLKQQKHKAEFTGGLEPAILKPWHVDLLIDLKPKQMFFAYDTPDDLEPLRTAGKMLLNAGFTTASHALRCYVLVGYPGDTFEHAERRLAETMEAGFMPMAMLYRDDNGVTNRDWQRFQRKWARPAIIAGRVAAGWRVI